MKAEIKTQIQINATYQEVWAVLAKTEDYPNWNPFLKSLTGNLIAGEKIKIRLLGMSFKPVVQEVRIGKKFSWLGKLGFKGIFDGYHQFELKPNNEGTLFVHKESFSGFLTKWFMKNKSEETKKGFEEMNLALKNRVEGYTAS